MWTSVSPLLRRALWADAVISGASGAVLAADHALLSTWFGLPATGLAAAGWFCVVYAAIVALMARSARLPRPLVWLVIVGNAVWCAGSVALLFEPGLSPTARGEAYVLVQALSVAVLAELQWLGLHRSTPLARSATRHASA